MSLDNNLNIRPKGIHRSFFYFSKRSQDQLKAHVLMHNPLLPFPDFSLVSIEFKRIALNKSNNLGGYWEDII